MKANELMIGDWVVGCSGEPFKIGMIDPDFLYWNEVQPIPLTTEILEKNGFAYDWDEDVKLMVCGSITIEIGDNYKRWKDGKMYLRRILAPIYYVHQLQHALRLCGVDKSIEL